MSIERSLSSVIRTTQFKTESSLSSKASLSSAKSKKSILSIRSKKSLDQISYAAQESKILSQAHALLNKPVKNVAPKLDEEKSTYVDLKDYEDPYIRIKLEHNTSKHLLDSNSNSSRDESDNDSVDSTRQSKDTKSLHSKLFQNIVKDYDLIGIAPVIDSAPISSKIESKKLEESALVRSDTEDDAESVHDERHESKSRTQNHDEYDSDDAYIDRLIHPESQKQTKRSGSIYQLSGNILKTKKSQPTTQSASDKKVNKKSGKKSLNRKPSNPAVRKYFRHQVRIVIALIKIVEFAYSKANKKYIKARPMDKVAEMVQEALTRPQNTNKKYVFNKDYYKASKQTDCSKEVQFILTTPPEMRTIDQIKLVRLQLLCIKAFQEYPINMLDKICQCAYYQKVSAKRVIIRQGQVADSFYFILTGQAMVTVMEQDKNTEEIKDRIATIIKDGACFGELAFIFSTTRTATVTSITDMELISIGREDFFEIFMTKNNGEEPEHIKYLRNCAFMKYWPIEKLIDYPQNCHYHYYKRGQVIVHNSNHCDYIYILKSGICQVLKKLNDVKPRRILSARIPQIKEEYISSAYHPKVDSGLPFKRGKTAGAFLKSDKTSNLRWSAQTSSSFQAPETKPIFLLMQVLKEGDIFGLDLLKFDETDNDYPNPEVSLVSQGAEVLMLSMEYFLRFSNDDVKDHIRQMIQVYPRTEEMQRRLQHEADWNCFKNETLHSIYSKSKN